MKKSKKFQALPRKPYIGSKQNGEIIKSKMGEGEVDLGWKPRREIKPWAVETTADSSLVPQFPILITTASTINDMTVTLKS